MKWLSEPGRFPALVIGLQAVIIALLLLIYFDLGRGVRLAKLYAADAETAAQGAASAARKIADGTDRVRCEH